MIMLSQDYYKHYDHCYDYYDFYLLYFLAVYQKVAAYGSPDLILISYLIYIQLLSLFKLEIYFKRPETTWDGF